MQLCIGLSWPSQMWRPPSSPLVKTCTVSGIAPRRWSSTNDSSPPARGSMSMPQTRFASPVGMPMLYGAVHIARIAVSSVVAS